jgi:hypothetical protein
LDPFYTGILMKMDILVKGGILGHKKVFLGLVNPDLYRNTHEEGKKRRFWRF